MNTQIHKHQILTFYHNYFRGFLVLFLSKIFKIQLEHLQFYLPSKTNSLLNLVFIILLRSLVTLLLGMYGSYLKIQFYMFLNIIYIISYYISRVCQSLVCKVKEVLFYFQFARSFCCLFSNEWTLNFAKCLFCIYWDGHMFFLLCFCLCVAYYQTF